MAYKGLAYPVFAPIESESANGIKYKAGGFVGRAMEYELDPTYADTSEYSDMNDLDPDEEFAFADITLKTAETSGDFERGVMGAEQSSEEVAVDNDIESTMFAMTGLIHTDLSKKTLIGLGLIRPLRYRGTTSWVMTWLYKVYILSIKDNTETKGKDINYSTPEIKARSIPANNGNWKKDMTFGTLAEARSYLEFIADGSITTQN